MKNFEYFEPKTVKEAIDLLKQYNRGAKLLAGGTDLMVGMKEGFVKPKVLINLKTIKGLDKITYSKKEGLTVAPLTTWTDIRSSRAILEHYPILREAASVIGSHQTRNRGTIGGRFNRYRKNGRAIMAKAHWDAPSELADKVTGRGNFSFAFSFGAKAIEVEVDPGTGKVEIVQVAAAQDVGRAINPLGVECQIEGGVHMGLGYALTEEIMLDPRGRMVNDHFVDYKILTPLDMPPVESIIVESIDPIGPFGAKGVGEMATIGTPEAISAAIHDAAQVWIKDPPFTPEKVWMALKKKEEGSSSSED